MRYFKLMAVMFLLSVGACSSQGDSSSEVSHAVTPSPTGAGSLDSEATMAAERSLDVLAEAVGRDNPQKRGFESVEEAKSAQLGAPLSVFMIGLSSLAAYRTGQAPQSLLVDLQKAMFPVVVNGDVRSSVVVARNAEGKWEAIELGHQSVIKAAHARRQSVRARAANATIVEVPAIGARFLSHEENGEMMWTPIFAVEGTTLRAGEAYPASDVLSVLQPFADSPSRSPSN